MTSSCPSGPVGAPTSRYFNLTYPAPFVAHVEINRPEKMNAWIEEMWLALPPLFNHLSTCPDTRAIILSGAGDKAFTTGLDLQAASQSTILNPNSFNTNSNHDTPQPDPARTAHRFMTHILQFQASLTAVADCRKPIIAALHGYCYGLGVDLISCVDVRIAAHNTRFAVKEVDIGIAADIGTLSRLPKIVGSASWVKDVCLTARVFDAAEAKQAGLVSWVSPTPSSSTPASSAKQEVYKHALAWASTIASKSPVAVQGTKELLDWSWSRSVEDGLRYTAVWNSAQLQTRDVGESMQAGVMKKKARFEKL